MGAGFETRWGNKKYLGTRRPLSRGIFSATRFLQKKCGEEENRTHDLLAGKHKKFQATARVRTHDLLAGKAIVEFWHNL